MMTRRRLTIIIVVVLAVVIAGIGIVAMMTANNNQPSPEEEAAEQTAVTAPFRIDNFYAYPDIELSTREAITSSIQNYLTDIPRDALPVGIIRDGSYKQTSEGTIANTTFIVDIDVLKRTYRISLGNDSSTDESSLYVLCPTTDELRYPAFNCKDDLSEQ